MIASTLGPYRIDRELGSGGMGKVYAATAPDGMRVAVKVVHPHLVEQPGARERFLREALSGLSIASQNVVRTIECLETEVEGKRVPALVLEFVEGRDLAALLDETKRVPEDLCRYLAREVARGLDAIHGAGIVHRDMKPGNVLMTSAGEVKVMDLGLARQASGEDRMSQTGTFMGTAAYAPPEQFFGKKDLDPRSDLYSLGAMLFELATGRVPFQAEAIGDLVRQVLRDKAPRIGTLAPQTTPFFEELVATLLEKQPERRFATAAELGEVLDGAEAGDWWAAVSVRVQMESRKPLRRVRVQRETEMWGREDDLAELRGVWEGAKGGKGAVVLLEGEAGIGKTRLVEELLAAIEMEDDAQILVGRHDPAGAGSAAEALGAAFRAQLGTDDLDARLAELLPETPLLVPAFAALLRGEPAPADAMALTPESLRTLFVSLARALAADAPLVLVVDDLHFATDEGRALFQAVALAVEGSPLMLVGTARPGLPAKWVDAVTRRENAVRHEVRRLDEETVRASLVRHLGGGWEAESVAAQVASRAGGNPYFVVEVLRQLGERGHLARTADGAWRVTALPSELGLPATVRELVAQRLAALAAANRDLLEAAACQGHEFDGRLVAESLARPRMEVLRALGRLEHATSLVRAAGTRFAFDHHIVHEVLYEMTAPSRRETLHAAIADAIERQSGAASIAPADVPGRLCAELAEHLLKGARGERALRYLEPALTHLDKSYLHAAAAAVATRALAVPGLVAGRARVLLLLRLASVLAILGQPAAARTSLDEARTLADADGDPVLRTRALAALGVHLSSVSRFGEAEAVLRDAVALACAAGDPDAEASATGSLSNALLNADRYAESIELQERALALARQIGNRRREAVAMGNLGNVLRAAGRMAEGRAYVEQRLRLARELGDRREELSALGDLGNAFSETGQHAEALAQLEQALRIARETGDRPSETKANSNLGGILSGAGRHAEARERLERTRALAREIGTLHGEAIALVNLGPADLALGDVAAARRVFEEALALCRKIRARYPESFALAGLADVAAEEGDDAAALRLAQEALSLRREIGHAATVADSLIQAAEFLRRTGDPAAARAAAEEALASHRELGNAPNIAHDLALLACLPGGDPAAAARAIADGGADADSPSVRWLLWLATGDRSHLAAARRLLDAALAKVPAEHHVAMLASVRLNREIVAACSAGGDRLIRRTNSDEGHQGTTGMGPGRD